MRTWKSTLYAVSLLLALPLLAASPADSAAPSEDEALRDDILDLLDLPLVAEEARAAGIDEEEIEEALTVTREAGLTAADATDALSAEVEATQGDRGQVRGFSTHVRQLLAAGHRGQQLAAKIKERKEVLERLSEAEKAKLDAKIDEHAQRHREWHKKLLDKRKELRAKGKQIVVDGLDLHAERKRAAMARFHARKGTPHDHAAHEMAEDAAKAAHEDAKDAHDDAKDAHEDAKDAHEDAKDAAKDAKDAAKDAKDAAKDAHEHDGHDGHDGHDDHEGDGAGNDDHSEHGKGKGKGKDKDKDKDKGDKKGGPT